jgi:hypothetical protein
MLHKRWRSVEEVEENPTDKRIDIGKRLGLAPSMVNSIVAREREIQEQIVNCG